MARPKKVKQDEVVTIVDDKNTEALLPGSRADRGRSD